MATRQEFLKHAAGRLGIMLIDCIVKRNGATVTELKLVASSPRGTDSIPMYLRCFADECVWYDKDTRRYVWVGGAWMNREVQGIS